MLDIEVQSRKSFASCSERSRMLIENDFQSLLKNLSSPPTIAPRLPHFFSSCTLIMLDAIWSRWVFLDAEKYSWRLPLSHYVSSGGKEILSTHDCANGECHLHFCNFFIEKYTPCCCPRRYCLKIELERNLKATRNEKLLDFKLLLCWRCLEPGVNPKAI